MHGLLVYVIPQINRFPRDQQFVLGDRTETKLLDVQESSLRAYYSREKRSRRGEAKGNSMRFRPWRVCAEFIAHRKRS